MVKISMVKRLFLLAFSVIAILLFGCMNEPDFTFKEPDKNRTLPPGSKFVYVECNFTYNCYDKIGKEYFCGGYPDDPLVLQNLCVRLKEEKCHSDSDCYFIKERCMYNRCVYADVVLAPNASTSTDKPQEEPPILLSCENNSGCPDWQYNVYRCKDIFKYGNVCVAYRAGALGEPGCTNDLNRDLLNGPCLQEDGEFCINGKPYITKCASTEWCVDGKYCVRRR